MTETEQLWSWTMSFPVCCFVLNRLMLQIFGEEKQHKHQRIMWRREGKASWKTGDVSLQVARKSPEPTFYRKWIRETQATSCICNHSSTRLQNSGPKALCCCVVATQYQIKVLLEVLTYCICLKKQATSLKELSRNRGFTLLTGSQSWKEILCILQFFFSLKWEGCQAASRGKNRTSIFISNYRNQSWRELERGIYLLV